MADETDPSSKSKFIAKVMQMGVDTINNELDVGSIFKKEAEGEDRTVKFIIYQDGDVVGQLKDKLFEQGYHVNKGRIDPVTLDSYTVTYKLGESTWISLITQRRQFRQLFWYGEMEAEGDYVLRDFMIWSHFFEQYSTKLKIPFMARTLLRPEKGVV
jgi:hypothetical protein